MTHTMNRVRKVFQANQSPVVATTFANLLTIAVSLGSSILVARSLGASGRGEFAALMAIFGLALVLGEFGQSASVTFHVARDREHGGTYVASSRRIMLLVGSLMVVSGLVLIQALDHWRDIPVDAYRIALLGCLVNSVAAPYTYAVQAVSLARWNLVRLTQPMAYIVCIVVLSLSGHLSLVTLASALVASTTAALLLAFVTCRGLGFTDGTPDSGTTARLARYGAAEASAGIPTALNQHLDKLLLATFVTAADLGFYAVAFSVVAMAVPFSTAISSVFFPRLARAGTNPAAARALTKKSLLGAGAVALPLVVVLACLGQWALPVLFGSEFATATALLWWLAPAGLFRSLSIVLAGLLRGLGHPGRIAVSQALGVTVSLSLIAPTVNSLGIRGAGIAMGLGELISLLSAGYFLGRIHRQQARADAECVSN